MGEYDALADGELSPARRAALEIGGTALGLESEAVEEFFAAGGNVRPERRKEPGSTA